MWGCSGVGEAHGCVILCKSLWLPGSLHQSAELLQQPVARPGPPFISPADTAALRRNAAGGNCRGYRRLEKWG